MQASYRHAIHCHQTPQWQNGYDYKQDPLWHQQITPKPFEQLCYYHCDHLGTPQEMSDPKGHIVWAAQYKAWGQLVSSQTYQHHIWESNRISNPLRFQGQYFDDETGLHYNRYRYYSPTIGRFISKDPIGLLGGLNGYQYAPNPVGWVDPLGLNRNNNQNNWLQYHEGGSHRGHTIDRHVGKDDCYLRGRLQQRRPRVSAASTYPNQQIAEDTISKAFKQVNPDTGNTNRKDIKEWVKTAPQGQTQTIKYQGDSIVGRGIKRSESSIEDRKNSTVVVRTNGKGKIFYLDILSVLNLIVGICNYD